MELFPYSAEQPAVLPAVQVVAPEVVVHRRLALVLPEREFLPAVKQEEKDIPMRPAALTNMPLIDEKLGNIAVNFWDLTWNDEHRHLPYEIRLLLSLTNAVGAGRMRQAVRELVKAIAPIWKIKMIANRIFIAGFFAVRKKDRLNPTPIMKKQATILG